MDPLKIFKDWFQTYRSQIKSDYFDFLRFASISADSAYRESVLACADWLVSYMRRGGLDAALLATDGFPIVYAEDLSAGLTAPTVLIYGHYDVQPVDPIELWKTPPFVPSEREGKIFARGAVDDKGQIFYAILAVIAYKQSGRSLPVNLKFCIEGEEEFHSMGLSKALPRLKSKLAADALLIVDFDSQSDGEASLTFGARGMASLEVVLTGSSTDLHSGVLGGLAYNPNRALAELLARLWDEKGRVAVPGFYDDVMEPEADEKKRYVFPIDSHSLERDFGIYAKGGEKGKSLKEANWFRPTLEINGMVGGYTGAGMKTVIPAQARAKISCRLVLNQDPERVCRAIASFLKEQAPQGMKVDVEIHGGVGAFRGSPDSFLARSLAKSAEMVTGKPCQPRLSGASIPIAEQMQKQLQTDVVGMGYGLSTDNIHAPNEHFDWKRFEAGFLTLAGALSIL